MALDEVTPRLVWECAGEAAGSSITVGNHARLSSWRQGSGCERCRATLSLAVRPARRAIGARGRDYMEVSVIMNFANCVWIDFGCQPFCQF